MEERLKHILRWSALPGASRHHWGTDIDIYSPASLPAGYRLQLIPEEYENGGYMADLTSWLNVNMQRFGFYRPYQHDLGGVAREPWHLSYWPLANKLAKQFTIDILDQCLRSHQVAGKAVIRHKLPAIWRSYITRVSKP